MGELFLARMKSPESGFERLVVIKRILPHLTDKDEFVNMFLDEARVAAQIHHSNVCQILELGQVEGRYYMALEYLEGVSMTQVIVGRRDYPELAELNLLVSVMTQACEGLHFAHNVRNPDGALAGVVHRDVNPKNLFVTSAGVTKVLDFGIVKAKDALNITRTGSVKGTYSYMSPEQIKAQPVDRRSDVFSLGIVTWEAVTGVRLFKRENDFHTWRAITEEDAPPPSEFREDIPAGLDHAIMTALTRDREARWATAREFAVALEEGLGTTSLTPVKVASAIEKAFDPELEQQRARAQIESDPDEEVVDEWSVPTTIDMSSVTPSAQRLIDTGAESSSPGAEAQLGSNAPALAPTPTPTSEPAEVDSYTGPGPTAVPEAPKRTAMWLAIGLIAAIFTLAAVLFVTRRTGGGDDSPPPRAEQPGDTRSAATPPVLEPDAAVAAVVPDAAVVRPAIDAAPEPVDAAVPTPDAAASAAVDAAPKKPDRPDRPKRPDRSEEPRGFGTLTVNAKPYGTVFINGRRVGITPIVGHRLPAGRHRVKVVSSEDNSVKGFSVRIEPDKGTRRMVRW